MVFSYRCWPPYRAALGDRLTLVFTRFSRRRAVLRWLTAWRPCALTDNLQSAGVDAEGHRKPAPDLAVQLHGDPGAGGSNA